MNADPRLQERKLPARMVSCKLGPEESGSVLNLSENGLCFESPTPIEEKHLLQLRLSIDADSAIEATGQLAWLDPAKCIGGLRFLELSAPAREQIRAWLKEPSAASSSPSHEKDAAAIAKSAVWQDGVRQDGARQDMTVSSMQLVPMERHRAQARRLFLLGALLGFGISTVLMILVFVYAGGSKPGGQARTVSSPNRAAQSSAAQPQPSVAQRVYPSASVTTPSSSLAQPPATNPLATKPAALQAVPVAAPMRSPRQQNLQPTRASSTDVTSRTSLPSATPQPVNPQPVNRRPVNTQPVNPQPVNTQLANKDQPLEASQQSVASAPAASEEPSPSEQAQRPKKLSPTLEQLWSRFQAGNMKAAVALADLYIRGDGVPVNCEQARILLQVASKKNNAEASKKLQELDQTGCPANTD